MNFTSNYIWQFPPVVESEANDRAHKRECVQGCNMQFDCLTKLETAKNAICPTKIFNKQKYQNKAKK